MKRIFLFLLLVAPIFALSYGGDAFPNQSQITNGWFINTTHFYPYPIVFNQTNETNVSVNSSWPFNISFKFQLNNQEGEVKNLNITSPQLSCTDYNNDMTYGNYSNHTINDWQCNGTNIQAGYRTFQFEITDMLQYSSNQQFVTGTYIADVAQPSATPLAYAPDNMMGKDNASYYGVGYASVPTVGTTPATTNKAMEQLKATQQKQNVSSMAVLLPITTPPRPITPQLNNSQSDALAPNMISTPASPTPVPVARPPPTASPALIPVPNDIGAPAPPSEALPWWALLMIVFALFAWAVLAVIYFWITRKKEPPKTTAQNVISSTYRASPPTLAPTAQNEKPEVWFPDYHPNNDPDIILAAAEKKDPTGSDAAR